jgi:hypothetical protein
VQLGLGALHVSPEFRYTYWTDTTINMSGSQEYQFQSTQNQVDLLVAIVGKLALEVAERAH